jgi:hypothetical protein
MGNILITGLSAFLPITIHKSIIPTLFSPDLLGSSPWTPPNQFTYIIFYFFFMWFFLWLFSFIGNMYYSLMKCDKKDPKQAAIFANYTPLVAFVGIFINNTILLPFIKSMILSVTTMVPYSHHIVNGIITMPFVFLGTLYSQRLMNQVVCGFY